MKSPHPWLCELCFPNGIDIGKITDGYYLCFRDNQYFVLAGQGHSNDELFYWSEKPFPDPVYGKTDQEIEAMDENLFRTSRLEIDQIIQNTDLCILPHEGHRFIESCIKSGNYNQKRDGYNFELWLFNKCGVLINEYEKEQSE